MYSTDWNYDCRFNLDGIRNRESGHGTKTEDRFVEKNV